MVDSTLSKSCSSNRESSRGKLRFTSRSLRIFLITTTTLLTLFVCLLFVNFEPERSTSNWRVFTSLQKNVQHLIWPQKPRILLWTSFFSNAQWMPQPKDVGCPVDCEVTSDRAHLNLSQVVVFHLRNVDINDLPKWRTRDQRWALYNLEAPPNTPSKVVRALAGKINWTITYRTDSDLFSPYGFVRTYKADRPFIKSGRKKRQLVCWVVSHCHTSGQRETYVDALRQYVPVYVYGKCGQSSCPTSDAQECYDTISASCKFYLSFENSLCRDYITEKLFQALLTDMVPIVMGGADYSKFLPNHSYINALDYENPKDLGTYLLELDKDDAKYEAFHAWKKNYEVLKNPQLSCNLCKMLHSSPMKHKSYKDLSKWWYGVANCFAWPEYFNS